jgi:2-dehydro-3-deoxygluconokinase
MSVFVGGAELNVATALARWGVPAKYCTALPDHYLSKEICEEVRQKNIDVSSIHFSGDRIGIYYLPQGADLKNAGVIYDRAHSSFAELRPGELNWDKALEGCTWFHFSAISPALSAQTAAVCAEALQVAREKGLFISVDLNYRAKLWKYGKSPVEVMPQLVEHCDLVMGNIWAASDLLGITVDSTIHEKKSKPKYLAHAGETALAIMKRFSKCRAVANTFRFDDNNGIHYYAALDNAEGQFVSPEFSTDLVFDKVGSGDCFMGGLIYGTYKKHHPRQIIDFAAAAAVGKLQEWGDATNQTVEDVNKLIQQHGERSIHH